MARRRFFVAEIRNRKAELSGADARHLTRVLRVERGQSYEISDNQRVCLAEVVEAHKDRVVFTVVEDVPPRPLPVHLTLLVSLVKFDRMEWILEKGTELGVARFVPVAATRSGHGLERALGARRERWRKVLVESAQQARRDHIPELADWLPFSRATSLEADHRWLLDEEGGTPFLEAAPAHRRPSDRVLVLTGPEGGWTEAERACGWPRVTLGPHILRTETACLAAAAIVAALWTG